MFRVAGRELAICNTYGACASLFEILLLLIHHPHSPRFLSFSGFLGYYNGRDISFLFLFPLSFCIDCLFSSPSSTRCLFQGRRWCWARFGLGWSLFFSFLCFWETIWMRMCGVRRALLAMGRCINSGTS